MRLAGLLDLFALRGLSQLFRAMVKLRLIELLGLPGQIDHLDHGELRELAVLLGD
jgi:hypothetical protein